MRGFVLQSEQVNMLFSCLSFFFFACAWCQGPVACRRKEKKTLSDEENSDMDADPSTSEEEAAGALNITDEMKRMLNHL